MKVMESCSMAGGRARIVKGGKERWKGEKERGITKEK